MTNFADKLAAAVRQKQTPVVVGLDPRFESLPESVRRACRDNKPTSVAAAVSEFCRSVIDAVAPLVPAVKPQVAFFEQLGPPGLAALAEVIAHARRNGLLVIVDAKRNDIGSTAEAYAAAYFGSAAPWPADALTVSPYLGDDSLSPFIDAAPKVRRRRFHVGKNLEPRRQPISRFSLPARQPLYRHVAHAVDQSAIADLGACGYGNVGAVVGATYPEQLAELRAAMPHAWILVPGYGSQGGTATDVAAAFDAAGLGAIVNNARGIIFAHQSKRFASFGEARWQEAVEAATREMIDALAAGTDAGKLRRGGTPAAGPGGRG